MDSAHREDTLTETGTCCIVSSSLGPSIQRFALPFAGGGEFHRSGAPHRALEHDASQSCSHVNCLPFIAAIERHSLQLNVAAGSLPPKLHFCASRHEQRRTLHSFRPQPIRGNGSRCFLPGYLLERPGPLRMTAVDNGRPSAMQHWIGDVMIRMRALDCAADGTEQVSASEHNQKIKNDRASLHRLLPRHVINLAVHVVCSPNNLGIALIGTLG